MTLIRFAVSYCHCSLFYKEEMESNMFKQENACITLYLSFLLVDKILCHTFCEILKCIAT